MWPVASRLLGLKYKEKVYLKDSFYMYGSMEDILSREILFLGPWKKNLWEPETLKILLNRAKVSKNSLIAGAHMGYLVLYAAKASDGMIHSFEPIPWLYERCKENISINHDLKERIVLSNVALGENAGAVEIFEEGIRSSNFAYSGGHMKHKNIIKCPVVAIDEYEKEKNVEFDLILLDIEGFEWFALNGAEKALSRKPDLILEISPRVLSHTDVTPKMIFDRVEKLDYEIFFLDDRKNETVSYSTELEEKYLNRDYVNIFATVK